MSPRARMLACLTLLACGAPDVPTDAHASPSDGGDLDASASAEAGSDGSTCAVADADHDGQDAIACGGSDCDDADANRFPGNIEVCDAAHDEDCNPSTVGMHDMDTDGYTSATCCNLETSGAGTCGPDCDDTRIGVHPDAPEVCNGIDDDCDGAVDEEVLVLYFGDCDDDRVGGGTPVSGCNPPATAPACPTAGHAWTTIGGDCDDADGTRFPGNAETCTVSTAAHDEDCDPSTLGADGDGDGEIASMCCNGQPDGTTLCGTDCDDGDPNIHTGVTETCDDVDEDCDNLVDEGIDLAACAAVRCGTTLCTGGASCCVDGATLAMMCATGSCPPRNISLSCDGAEDCPAGEGCCGTSGLAACATTSASCSSWLCNEDADCPAGQHCTGTLGAPLTADRTCAP